MGYRSRNGKGSISHWIFGNEWVIFLTIALIAILTTFFFAKTNQQIYIIKVQDAYVKNSNSDGKYLINAELEDGSVKVFENTDSFWNWKFNSSDIYARIKPGNTYKIWTAGYRIHFLSCYENILDVDLISTAEGKEAEKTETKTIKEDRNNITEETPTE